MVQSQANREAARKALSHDDFLAGVAPRVRLFPIAGSKDPKFARMFELLNKTNQFNSTGRRWTAVQCDGHLAAGGRIYAFEVEDKYTKYGLVGVLFVHHSDIVQFVMSCRVLGLDVEIAVLAELTRTMARPVIAQLVKTDANMPIRDLWARAGFTCVDGVHRLEPTSDVPSPTHVTLTSMLDVVCAAATS
jgi:FkbH-like protein